jgi:hypothetical protein
MNMWNFIVLGDTFATLDTFVEPWVVFHCFCFYIISSNSSRLIYILEISLYKQSHFSRYTEYVFVYPNYIHFPSHRVFDTSHCINIEILETRTSVRILVQEEWNADSSENIA